MSKIDLKIGNIVSVSGKESFGLGVIVGIDGNQADIFFKNYRAAETAYLKDIKLADQTEKEKKVIRIDKTLYEIKEFINPNTDTEFWILKADNGEYIASGDTESKAIKNLHIMLENLVKAEEWTRRLRQM